MKFESCYQSMLLSLIETMTKKEHRKPKIELKFAAVHLSLQKHLILLLLFDLLFFWKDEN